MSAAIEIVSFKLKQDASEHEFLSSNPALQTWIAGQPGFQYRALAKKDDGSWVDTVFWDSMDNAKKAGAAFADAEEAKPLMAFIDDGSVDMQHLSVVSSSCESTAA